MAYHASNGRVYSHKESPSEYEARHGGSVSLWGDSPGCTFVFWAVIIICLIHDYWQYVVGALVVALIAYMVYREIFKTPKIACPACGKRMRIEKVWRMKQPRCDVIVPVLLFGGSAVVFGGIILFNPASLYSVVGIGVAVALAVAGYLSLFERVQVARCRKCGSEYVLGAPAPPGVIHGIDR